VGDVATALRSRHWLPDGMLTRRIGSVVAVLLGTLTTSLFTRDFGVSLADIRGAYGLSVDEGAWLSTVTNAAQLLSAPAVPLCVVMFGPRRILGWSASAFILVTALAPMASGMVAIFVLHATIGFLLGCFVPATLAIVFANLSPRYWLFALALYSLRLTLALHTGVSLSGWFVEDLGWQAIYWQATLFGIAFLFLALVSFPQREIGWGLFSRTNKGEVAMFCVGLTLVYVGLDQGNRLDWLASGTVVACLTGGMLLVLAAIAWQFFSPVPFAHPAALLRRNIHMPLIIVTLFGVTSGATSVLIPNFLAVVGHLKPEQSGAALWGVDLVQLVALPVAIWSIRRADPRLTVAGGLLLVMFGCWLGSGITHNWRAGDFITMSVLIGVGNAAVLLTMIAMTVANAAREELISIVAYIQIPRVLGPELGLAILTTLLRKREAVASVLVGSNVERVRGSALDFHISGMGSVIRREATVLSYADAWTFCFWVAALAMLLAMFLRRTPSHPLVKLPRP
jgi:DHA2 family multidrug resistance protein